MPSEFGRNDAAQPPPRPPGSPDLPPAVGVRIGEPEPGGDFPVALYLGSQADVLDALAGVARAPDAIGTLPATLGLADPVAAPPAGRPEDPRARDWLRAHLGSDAAARQANAAPVPPSVLQSAGRVLGALLEGAVGPRWTAARREAQGRAPDATGVRLRTFVDVRPAALRRLPWELLTVDGQPLFRAIEWCASRWSASPAAQPAGEPALPITVLLVLGCRRTDQQVRWQDELHAVFGATSARVSGDQARLRRHRLDLELFDCGARHRGGAKQALLARLEALEPHVLHFVGHAFTEGDEGALELWDAATERQETVGAAELCERFAGRPPRIALLNACQTSGPIADALHAAGVPAVIAMQGDVAGIAAAGFAQRFYAELVCERPVDVCVALARRDLALARVADWARPALVLAVPPTDVLPPAPLPDVAIVQRLLADEPLAEVAVFADRRAERRRLRARTTQGAAARVHVVTGDAGTGKSWLVKLFVESCLLGGWLVIAPRRPIDGSRLDAVELLRALRGRRGAVDALLHPALYERFPRFNAALAALLAGRQPLQELPAIGGAEDDGAPWNRATAWPDTVSLAFHWFRADLQALAREVAPRPVLLVLDQIGQLVLESDFADPRPTLGELLAKPVAQGELGDVHLIVGGTAAELRALGLGHLRPPEPLGAHPDFAHGCVLGGFDDAEPELVLRELVAHVLPDLGSVQNQYMDVALDLVRPPASWKHVELAWRMLGRVAEQAGR